MTTPRLAVRAAALLATFAAVCAIFVTLVRPWFLTWGATPAESARALAGDEIVTSASGQETRAITIHAPADRVWPWLAQLGQDRGGFYSYDLLENLVGCQMPTDDRLRPERQAWQVGDRLWMYPPGRAGGIGYATLRVYDHGRAMVFGTHVIGTPIEEPENVSWAFVVEPVDASTTRLIVRGRGAASDSWLARIIDRAVFEPAHFVMERRMLIGIAQLAEGANRARRANHVQVLLWMLTFALFVVSVALVLAGRRWQRALIALVAAGAVFQILTFVQPSPSLGVLLVAGVWLVLAWPGWRPAVAAHAG